MAIEFVSASQAADATSGTAVTVTKPSGAADGDLIVVALTNINNQSYTPPSGWTAVAATSGGIDASIGVFYKVASSEGASWQFTQGAEGWGAWEAVCYRGVDTSDPIVAASTGDAYVTSNTTISAAAVTTENADDLVLWFGGHYDGGAMATNPSGFTERVDAGYSDLVFVWSGDKTFSVGSTGAVTGTLTRTTTGKDARMVVLKAGTVAPSIALLNHLLLGD